MSCLLGVETNGRVLLAGDSGVWSGEDVMAFDGKVQKIKRGLVVGFAGHMSLGLDLVRLIRSEAGSILAGGPDELSRILRDHDTPDDEDASLLVGIRDRLFVADEDGSVFQCRRGYAGAGCYQYAVGYLWAIVSGHQKHHLKQALKCQAAHTVACLPPFKVVST